MILKLFRSNYLIHEIIRYLFGQSTEYWDTKDAMNQESLETFGVEVDLYVKV